MHTMNIKLPLQSAPCAFAIKSGRKQNNTLIISSQSVQMYWPRVRNFYVIDSQGSVYYPDQYADVSLNKL